MRELHQKAKQFLMSSCNRSQRRRVQQGVLTLMSVTADSWEEKEKLEKFKENLPAGLREVVKKHDKIFTPPDKEPPQRQIVHKIDLLPGAYPVKRRPYPLSDIKKDAMIEQVSDLERQGWIEPSNSPWGAPILFVPKKNKELRMCVDFRDLNAVTVDDSYPLPRIEVLLQRASTATKFTLVDLASGFHQIEVEKGSRPLTAFRLPEPVKGHSCVAMEGHAIRTP